MTGLVKPGQAGSSDTVPGALNSSAAQDTTLVDACPECTREDDEAAPRSRSVLMPRSKRGTGGTCRQLPVGSTELHADLLSYAFSYIMSSDPCNMRRNV